MRFEGKNVLVTGGGAGIGAAACLKFAEEGGFVIIVDRIEERGNNIVAKIEEADGKAVFEHVDLADAESIQKCCEAVANHVSALHVLVNNAGIVTFGTAEGATEEQWHPQIEINLKAPLRMTQGLLPLMKKEGGAIVNVTSEAGYRPSVGKAVYDATKAAVGGLTRTMAAEFHQYGIRVNNVAPGFSVTEMHFSEAEDPAARKKELEEMTPENCIMRRLGRPHETANGIVFMASDEASFITATTLHVDGGRVAH